MAERRPTSVLIGLIAKAAADQVSSSPQFMEILARMSGNASPAESFFSMFLVILGFITTMYAVLAALKMQSEENEMHAEAILATPVSRLQWATGHLAIAIVGSAALLVVFGLVAGAIFGASMGNVGNELPRVFFASLAYLPAIWIIAGIAVALFGLLPRMTIVSWGALVICLLVELAGDMQIAGGSPTGSLAVCPCPENIGRRYVCTASGRASHPGGTTRHCRALRATAPQYWMNCAVSSN
jgi:ABC-2 type transport system permease protein